MNRRSFLSMLGISAATLAVDPEALLWTPEKKTIFIPKAIVDPGIGLGDGVTFLSEKGFVDGPAIISRLVLHNEKVGPQYVEMFRNGPDGSPLLTAALSSGACFDWWAAPQSEVFVPEGERVSLRNAEGLKHTMIYRRWERGI
jgi:hypothetical protein